MCRHCSSFRKPRWHLHDERAGCLPSRASCLSRHTAASRSPSGDTAASAAQSSRPRYNASQRGSAEQMRRASTQSVWNEEKENIDDGIGNTPSGIKKSEMCGIEGKELAQYTSDVSYIDCMTLIFIKLPKRRKLNIHQTGSSTRCFWINSYFFVFIYLFILIHWFYFRELRPCK